MAIFAVLSAVLIAPSARPQAVSGQVSLVPVINTVAGNGVQGYSGDGGPAIRAELGPPFDLAVDSVGNLYIADWLNGRIRKVAANTGIISTVAGNGTLGYSGDGGPATSAELGNPYGVTVDSADNIYIADPSNKRIRKVAANTGIISTVAGNGTYGYSGDGGPATSAELDAPQGVTVDSAGNLYIADSGNNVIRKVTAATGIISTVAGNGYGAGTDTGGYSGDGGPATSAELNNPNGVAVDSTGNLYIADYGNQRIREVTAATGIISTVAGNGTLGYSGDGGPATSAELSNPYGVTVDSASNLYIADRNNQRIRKVITATGTIGTVAGNGTIGYSGDGGAATRAELNFPQGVTVDSAGNLYIADTFNNRIREVSTNATFPATAVGSTSASQTVQIQLTAASAISSITVPPAQNHVQEFTVGAISSCATDGVTSNPVDTVCDVPVTFNAQYPGLRTGALTLNNGGSIVGSVGLTGTGKGPLSVFQPGTASVMSIGTLTLNTPIGVAVDNAGNVYIADSYNNRMVEVTASGAASVLNMGGLTLSDPFGVVMDGAGDVYIGDFNTASVVEVMAGGTVGVLSTGSLGLRAPWGVAVDSVGDIYIADGANHRIVEVTAGGTASVLNIGGLYLYPAGLAVDGAGNLYIADSGNNRVVEVTAGGAVSVLSTGSLPLNTPSGVAVDSAGDVYIADGGNNRVVEVAAGGAASVLSTGSLTLSFPRDVAVDGAGDLYIADTLNNRVVKINQAQQSLMFPSTNIGQSSAQQVVTVTNIGNQPLAFTDVTATTNFNLNGADTTCLDSTTLTPGATCGLGVEFEPTSAGALSGTVNLIDNSLNAAAPNNVQQIGLGGTGVGFAATIALGESATTVAYGTAVTVTATLSGSNGAATGYITYTLDGVLQPPVTLSSNGVAQFALPTTLAPGTYSVLVSYGGDTTNYTIASTSEGFTLTVTKATQTITFSPIGPKFYGSVFALTATSTAGSSLPVTVAVQSGPATISGNTVTITGLGTVVLAATQPGNTDYFAATPVTQSFTVTAAPTLASLSTASSVAPGQFVTLTATIASTTTGTPTGTVTFYYGSRSIGTSTIGASGVAALTTHPLPVGRTNTFTASYGGTVDYLASTSPAVTVAVVPPGQTPMQ